MRRAAAGCLALADRLDDAKDLAASIQPAQPGYGVDDFLKAFRFGEDVQALLRHAARRVVL